MALALPVLLYNFSKLNLDHTLCGASPSLSRVAEYAQFALKLCMRVLPCHWQRLESISQMPNRNRKIWTLRVQVSIDLESRSLRA